MSVIRITDPPAGPTLMLHGQSDEGLMALVATGHKLAFDTLVRRHLQLAYGTAYRVSGGIDHEDIVQEAWTKVWLTAPSFQPAKAKFTTWFYRILVNTAIDRARQRKPSATIDWDMLPDNGLSPEAALSENQQLGELHDAVRHLPDRQRAAITLCYEQGMSNKQAADVMGMNIKALEGLLVRARRTLKDILTPKQEGGAHARQS